MHTPLIAEDLLPLGNEFGNHLSKLQNYLNFFLSRAEISRIRPSVFKCQSLKHFVSLWLIFDSCNLQAPDRKHESALEKRRGTTFGVRLAGSGQAAGS